VSLCTANDKTSITIPEVPIYIHIGVEVKLSVFYTSVLVGGEWSVHTLATLLPGEEQPVSTDSNEGGPQNQSLYGGEKKNPCPCWE
jgi:hypothetical protein